MNPNPDPNPNPNANPSPSPGRHPDPTSYAPMADILTSRPTPLLQRRLPLDKNLQISGSDMKGHLADYSSVVTKRVRPRDRALSDKAATRALGPVEQRMAWHNLAGQGYGVTGRG